MVGSWLETLSGAAIMVVVVLLPAGLLIWLLMRVQRDRLLDALQFVEMDLRWRSFASLAELNATSAALKAGVRSIGDTELGGNAPCVASARGSADVEFVGAGTRLRGRRMPVWQAWSYTGAPPCAQAGGLSDLTLALDSRTQVGTGPRTVLVAALFLPTPQGSEEYFLGQQESLLFARLEVTGIDRPTRMVYGSFDLMLRRQTRDGSPVAEAVFVSAGRFGVRVDASLLPPP